MITGLRIDCKSAQSYFDVKPDITTFGKIFGGGLPIGIIAISKKIEQAMVNKKIKVFFGGTFSGNSINNYIANKVLKFILKNNNKFLFFKLSKN